jgi:hypothetical protein
MCESAIRLWTVVICDVRDVTRGRVRRPPLVGEVLIAALLIVGYGFVRHHATLREDAAFAHGRGVLSLEGRLGIDLESTSNQFLTNHQFMAEALCWWYQVAHLTVTFSVLAWCYYAWPAWYRIARNALVLTNVAGLIIFLAWPVAPPRLLPGAGYTDTVISTLGGGAPTAPDQYGAMPSLHLAWATWVTGTVWALALAMGLPVWVRVLAVIYPVITSVAVITTANHYVLDVAAGTAVAMLAMALAAAPVRSRFAAVEPVPVPT